MLASGAGWAQTADDRVTAGEVVDDETLKAFVEGAAAEIAAITDVAVGGRLRDRFRTDPDWNSRIDVPHPVHPEREPVHPTGTIARRKTGTC